MFQAPGQRVGSPSSSDVGYPLAMLAGDEGIRPSGSQCQPAEQGIRYAGYAQRPPVPQSTPGQGAPAAHSTPAEVMDRVGVQGVTRPDFGTGLG